MRINITVLTLAMTWLSMTPGKMLLTALATVVIMLSTTFTKTLMS